VVTVVVGLAVVDGVVVGTAVVVLGMAVVASAGSPSSQSVKLLAPYTPTQPSASCCSGVTGWQVPMGATNEHLAGG